MYYVLAVIFLLITYFALAKILSSIVKGCLVTVGIAVFVFGAYFFLKSTKSPVELFGKLRIDNFEVTRIR